MTMQSPTVETTITILSRSVELDFAALSKMSGREADSTRSLNHVMATGKPPPVRCSEWTVSTGAQIVDSVDAGVQQLLGLFSASWASIAALCSSHGYEVSVTSRVRIHDWNDRPFVELGAPSIELLQQLGAGWQLDWIDLSR
jgi:Domain of unknown function (DUF4279)